MKRLFTVCLCASLLQLISPASAEIIWVSLNGDTPDQSVLDAGLEEAPDEAYVHLLEDFDTVTHYVTHDDPTPDDLAILNAADLILISRAVNSGAFTEANETEFWNTMVETPVIMMSGYILRNNRLNFYSGATIPDTAGPVTLEAVDPAHPVFAGVNLDGNNVMVDNFSDGLVEIPEANPTTQRGISVITDPIVGGSVIASSTEANTAGGAIIAEWDEGATLNNGQVLSGRRMVFLSGSREAAGVPIPLGAGAFDLTTVGEQMFLNAVDYMFPGGLLGVPGDVNGDEVADLTDYQIIRDHFQQSVGSKEEGDLTRDGFVDFRDFRLWKDNRTAAVAANVSIPEPGSWLIALTAIGTLAALRKFSL